MPVNPTLVGNALTDNVSSRPVVWTGITFLFFAWAAVMTGMYATKETEAEDYGPDSYTYVDYAAVMDDETGLCHMFDAGGRIDSDDTSAKQLLGQTTSAWSENGTFVNEYMLVFTGVNHDDGVGICQNTTKEGDTVRHYKASFHISAKIREDELQYETSFFDISCSEGDEECTVVYFEDDDSLNIEVFEGFMDELDIDVGIGTASVAFDETANCMRSKLNGDHTIRLISDQPCPLVDGNKYVVTSSINVDGTESYGLNDKKARRGCTYNHNTGMWSGHGGSCASCAADTDGTVTGLCRYHLTATLKANRGCFQPKDKKQYPYCWADFCDRAYTDQSCYHNDALVALGYKATSHGATYARRKVAEEGSFKKWDKKKGDKAIKQHCLGGKSDRHASGGKKHDKSPVKVMHDANKRFCSLTHDRGDPRATGMFSRKPEKVSCGMATGSFVQKISRKKTSFPLWPTCDDFNLKFPTGTQWVEMSELFN